MEPALLHTPASVQNLENIELKQDSVKLYDGDCQECLVHNLECRNQCVLLVYDMKR